MAAAAQEFHISVTPLKAQDEYLVRIERVAPGVQLAEELVKWPVEDWFAKARQLMNDPLINLMQGNSSQNLTALGQELYNALFQGSIRDSWIMALAIAQNQRSVLRLRLGLKGNRLSRLPWEVLHSGDRPLATGSEVAFSRYQLSTNRNRTPTPTNQNESLKILMAISGPSDQETLALRQEAKHLQEELSRQSPQGLPPIQLQILEQPGREELTQALELGHYQIFHYAGHSNLGADGGDLYLVSGKTGLTETFSGDDLAGLLVNNGVQMAVFNSCRGADTVMSEFGQEGNLANALVKRGIPSVLAMAEKIPDEVALTLTRLFYRNLNQGYPIDLSLSRARQGLISAHRSDRLYWALPVLYLHPEFDGFLTGCHNPKEVAKRLTLPDPSENLFLTEDEVLLRAKVENGTSARLLYEQDPSERWTQYQGDRSSYPPSSPFLPYPEDDPIGLGDDLDSDADYAEDLAIVSDLFRQMSDPNSATEQPVEKPLGVSNKEPEVISAAASPPQPLTLTSAIEVKQKKVNQRRIALPVIGATGAVAIALLGLWLWQNHTPQPGEILPGLNNPSSQQPSVILPDLKTAKTATVTAFAIEQFNQGNLAIGLQAVEELLRPERGALREAEAALTVVPQAQQDSPEVNFLRGRLAWQSVQTGNKKYSIDDARRYWEVAVKNKPNSPTYLNALGFAYYVQGNFERANDAWFKALYLIPTNRSETLSSTAQKESLTTYAGLALGLRQFAENQSPEKQTNLLNESIKLRQKVMTDNPIDFQPDALSRNWLWSEIAIKDWRSLLQLQP